MPKPLDIKSAWEFCMLNYCHKPARVTLVLVWLAIPAFAADITGRAYVVDGDTLRIAGTEIRLEGIDAPEIGQMCADAPGRTFDCGRMVRRRLWDMVRGLPVTCAPAGADRYGRTLAHCEVNGLEINEALVDAGLARAFVRYSAEYVAPEAEAIAAKRGLWAGQWGAPWDWRKLHPHP